MDGKKILVTGPAGHLALPIVRALAPTNDVWGLARFGDPASRAALEAMGVTCLAKDLARDPLDDLPDDFDHVLHAGAMVAMGSEDDMQYTFEVNVKGTGRLLERCRHVASFVFCSTGGVYKH
jgi:nucleoside-diphosphate-sugar epimerase